MSVDFAVFNKRVLHKKLHFYVIMEKYVFLSNNNFIKRKPAKLGAH